MKKRIAVLACMLSVFAVGGMTVYAAASNSQGITQNLVGCHGLIYQDNYVSEAAVTMAENSVYGHNGHSSCWGNGVCVYNTDYVYPENTNDDVPVADETGYQAVDTESTQDIVSDPVVYTAPSCDYCGGDHDTGACQTPSCGYCGEAHDTSACPSQYCGYCGGDHANGACQTASCGYCGGDHANGACQTASCGYCGGDHANGACQTASCGYCGGDHANGACQSNSGGGHHGGGHHGGRHH